MRVVLRVVVVLMALCCAILASQEASDVESRLTQIRALQELLSEEEQELLSVVNGITLSDNESLFTVSMYNPALKRCSNGQGIIVYDDQLRATSERLDDNQPVTLWAKTDTSYFKIGNNRWIQGVNLKQQCSAVPTPTPETGGSSNIPEDIRRLNLDPIARAAAVILKQRNPNVRFNSGRRELNDQARAMASNVVAIGPSWVENTYSDSAIKSRVVSALNANWSRIRGSQSAIQKVILDTFNANLSIVGQMSRHLSGMAFDVQPGSCRYSDLASLPRVRWYTNREGGLEIWHVDFQ